MALDPRFKKRSPLDPWKRALSSSRDVIQPSPDAFSTANILASDWKSGFPASLRVYYIVKIAEVLQISDTSVRPQDPTALVEADSIENAAYEASPSDCSYLSRIIENLKNIQCRSDRVQGLSIQVPELDFMPMNYCRTQPISVEHVIARRIDVAGRNDQQSCDIKKETITRNPNENCGPFQDLLLRDREILKSVEKLLKLFLAKCEIPVQLKRLEGQVERRIVTMPAPSLLRMSNALSIIPLRSACDALTSSFRLVTGELEKLKPQDFVLQMKYLDDLYAATVMQHLKKFVKDIRDIDLDKLEYKKQFMGVGGPKLLEFIKNEHKSQLHAQMGIYYSELFRTCDVQQGNYSQGHSTEKDNIKQDLEKAGIQLKAETFLITETPLPEQQLHQQDGE